MRHVTSSLLVALLGVGMVYRVAPVRSEDRPPDARPSAGPGKIYFVEGGRLACIQPDGRKPAQFPRELAGLGDFQPYTARIAPDGRRLAFGLGELRGRAMHPPSKIHVMDITRARGVELLVDLPGTELQHWAWSRDGRKLAFSS